MYRVELHLDTGVLGNCRVGLGAADLQPVSPGVSVEAENLGIQHDIVLLDANGKHDLRGEGLSF